MIIKKTSILFKLQNIWPDLEYGYKGPTSISLADGEYWCPMKPKVKGLLWKNFIDLYKYQTEVFDCLAPDMPLPCLTQGQFDIKSVSDIADIVNQNPFIDLKLMKEDGGWQKIIKIEKKQNEKNCVVYSGVGGVLLTTQDHKIRASDNSWQKIIDIGQNIKQCTRLNYDLPRDRIIEKDLTWLLGFFCSDGYALRDKSNRKFITFTNCHKEYIDKSMVILERYFPGLFKKTNYKSDEIGNKRGGVTLKKKQWKIIFNPCGDKKGCPSIKTRQQTNKIIEFFLQFYNEEKQKIVPKFIFNCEIPIIEAFLNGYWAGNGRKDSNSNATNLTCGSLLIGHQLYTLFDMVGKEKKSIFVYRNRPHLCNVYGFNRLKKNTRENYQHRTVSVETIPPFVYNIAVETGRIRTGDYIVKNCDDFSLILHAFVVQERYVQIKERNIPKEEWFPWAFGQVSGTRFDGEDTHHAINIVITSDKGVMLIEPQNDKIWKATYPDDLIYRVRM